jgi:drug/metabolite transporter (DMT)-like permease
MPNLRIVICTALALVAFAGNSLLCRAALVHTHIDAASFTTVRLLSGAVALCCLVWLRGGTRTGRGNWLSALALFAYAAGFSFSYLHLTAAAGALLLFGAVQTTMIGYGIWSGERMRWLQIVGVVLACGGLVGLLLPGLSAPPLIGALLMLGAGAAWGIYSLHGQRGGDALKVTAGNFARAVPMALLLSLFLTARTSLDPAGVGYAFLSGALTSGVGYAIWYTALPSLKSATAATVQLSVPILAAVGGIFFLGEALTLRLLIASVAIIGGIALVVQTGKRGEAPDSARADVPVAPRPCRAAALNHGRRPR